MKQQRPGEKIKMMSVDELLGVPSGDPVEDIDITMIQAFQNHPFKVTEDEKMEELIESIRYNGVLTPVTVRPIGKDKYEMISGHRRLYAVQKIGLDFIPAYIKEMSDDDAIIAMVDSNIQREEILPSEKAFAYRMRYEAMRRGAGRPKKNSSQVGTNYRADVDLAQQVGESKNNVHRYIRLTEVIPELLDMIDRGNIAVMTGVDISYIDPKIQKWLYEYIKENGVLKSYQVAALRDELSKEEDLSHADVISILNGNMPGRKPAMRVNFTSNQLRKYFPAYYTADEAKKVIEQLLIQWKKDQDKQEKQLYK